MLHSATKFLKSSGKKEKRLGPRVLKDNRSESRDHNKVFEVRI